MVYRGKKSMSEVVVEDKKLSPKAKESLGVASDVSITWLPVVMTKEHNEAINKVARLRKVKVADLLKGLIAEPLAEAMPAFLTEAESAPEKKVATPRTPKELPSDPAELEKIATKLEKQQATAASNLEKAKAALAAAKAKNVSAPVADADAE
jgi:hypothetical protein